jgi:hypothetical protein
MSLLWSWGLFLMSSFYKSFAPTELFIIKIFLCYKSFAPTELRVKLAIVFLQKCRSYGAKMGYKIIRILNN